MIYSNDELMAMEAARYLKEMPGDNRLSARALRRKRVSKAKDMNTYCSSLVDKYYKFVEEVRSADEQYEYLKTLMATWKAWLRTRHELHFEACRDYFFDRLMSLMDLEIKHGQERAREIQSSGDSKKAA